jgi:MFS family permease
VRFKITLSSTSSGHCLVSLKVSTPLSSSASPDRIAPFYPGAIYLLSLFYTRKEIALRIGVLYSANILATSFSGLIAAATFATIGGAQGLEGWRWLFIILGKPAFARSEQGLTYRYRYGCRRHRRHLPTPRPSAYHTLAHARSASARP